LSFLKGILNKIAAVNLPEVVSCVPSSFLKSGISPDNLIDNFGEKLIFIPGITYTHCPPDDGKTPPSIKSSFRNL